MKIADPVSITVTMNLERVRSKFEAIRKCAVNIAQYVFDILKMRLHGCMHELTNPIDDKENILNIEDLQQCFCIVFHQGKEHHFGIFVY